MHVRLSMMLKGEVRRFREPSIKAGLKFLQPMVCTECTIDLVLDEAHPSLVTIAWSMQHQLRLPLSIELVYISLMANLISVWLALLCSLIINHTPYLHMTVTGLLPVFLCASSRLLMSAITPVELGGLSCWGQCW